MSRYITRRITRNQPQVRYADHEDAIVEHVSRHLSRPAFVIHEIKSELVHLDIHVVRPTAPHDFWFLFTTGMSARPMTKPRDAPGPRFAEVSILLPPEWRLDRASWSDTRWFWPIRELRNAALLPHRSEAWLGDGHTIIDRTRDASRSLDASTRLASLLVLACDLLPNIIVDGTHRIELLTLHPIYPEELDYRFEHGLHALLRAFNDAGISEVIDPVRSSAIRPTAHRGSAA